MAQRSSGWLGRVFFVLGVGFGAFWATAAESLQEVIFRQQRVRAGRDVFVANCSGCHGLQADGNGPAATLLLPRPRNLVEGSFKFRSTPSGAMPTEEDLLRVIDRGIPRSAMPSFRSLAVAEKTALVAYIRSLRKDWSELQGPSYPISDPPPAIFAKKETLLASAKRGYAVFQEACVTCHGPRGLGDGEGGVGLVDGEGQPLKPADLSARNLKSGPSAKDAFRTITTGLDGTPMPSFAEVYNEAQRWDLVAYILTRRGQAAGIYPKDLDLSFGTVSASRELGK